MKAYAGVDVEIHNFLTSAQVGGEWPASCLDRFTPEERAPNTIWTGALAGHRAGLDDVHRRKPCPYRESNSFPSACSQ
jgi:hypothetical protein